MYNAIIVAGIVVSLMYTELTGLSAGLVVPGYLALSLHSPLRVAYTLALALLAMGCCRLLANWLILYGRRRFAVLILLTLAWDMLFRALGIMPAGVSAIGVVIPGILARELDRQGIVDTLLSVAITTALLAGLMLLWRRLA